MPYRLEISKENFKFSSSHFTVFSADQAEHLHGHNYRVSVELTFQTVDTQTQMAVDFNTIKKAVRALCDGLDEKILVPKSSPFLKISKSPHYEGHTEVRFQARIYTFPTSEVIFVPVTNITSEALAKHLHDELSPVIPPSATALTVTVQETAGQSAVYYA